MNMNFVKTEKVGTFGSESKFIFINLNQVTTVTITEECHEPSLFDYERCPTAQPIKTGYTVCIRMVGGEKISIKEQDKAKLINRLHMIGITLGKVMEVDVEVNDE